MINVLSPAWPRNTESAARDWEPGIPGEAWDHGVADHHTTDTCRERCLKGTRSRFFNFDQRVLPPATWVSVTAPPPGQCLTVAMTPASLRPAANALTYTPLRFDST